MKKVLALLLSALLLLSACAFAEAPAGGSRYSLSGLVMSSGDQSVDFSDITICVDISDDEPGALLLHVETAGETVGAIGFTQLDNLYIMHVESPTLGHKDYAIDPVKELAKSLDTVRDALIEMLQAADTTAVAQGIFDFVDHMDELPEEPVDEAAAEEPVIPELTIDGDIQKVLEDSDHVRETVTLTGETVSFNGVETPIPDGEYVHTAYAIDRAHFLQVMAMMAVNGEPIDAVEQIEEADADVEMVIDFYVGNDVDACFGSITVGAADDSDNIISGLGLLKLPTETGSIISFVIGTANGDEVTTVAFDVSKDEGMDVAFSADEVDAANLINLSDMSDEEEAEVLMQDLGTLAAETLSALIAPISAVVAEEAPAAE